MSRRVFFFAAAAMLATVLLPSAASATSYKGYGDTGWNWYNKRDCCEEAVYLAQDESIYQCEMAGGRAKVPRGSTRGLCDWDARGDGHERIYRCTATADVYCR